MLAQQQEKYRRTHSGVTGCFMFRFTDKLCKNCLLQNDPLHNVLVSDESICSLCAKTADQQPARDWATLEKAFVEKIEKHRGTRPYDAMIMMSGGKDSAYLASLLKDTYALNVLGFIMDINYEYPETFENARRLAEHLELPYVFYRQDPELMRRYYGFLFTDKGIRQQDGGQVCTFCGRFLIRTAVEYAAKMGIPMVFPGHNPDQVFLMGESIHYTPDDRIFMDFIMEALAEETVKATTNWKATYGAPPPGNLFCEGITVAGTELIFPFQYFVYQPEYMMQYVKKRCNWQPVKRFSKTYIASGCRLVKLWAYMAWLNGTNSYVDFEFCSQVRNKTLSKETAERFYKETAIDHQELADLIRELRIEKNMLEYLQPFAPKTDALLRLLEKGADSGPLRAAPGVRFEESAQKA